nr:MAG TPA: hypothetical protein [Caudoviricetes sp.]
MEFSYVFCAILRHVDVGKRLIITHHRDYCNKSDRRISVMGT